MFHTSRPHPSSHHPRTHDVLASSRPCTGGLAKCIQHHIMYSRMIALIPYTTLLYNPLQRLHRLRAEHQCTRKQQTMEVRPNSSKSEMLALHYPHILACSVHALHGPTVPVHGHLLWLSSQASCHKIKLGVMVAPALTPVGHCWTRPCPAQCTYRVSLLS